ncbi:helix-turn-helix domain-containing protein [Spirillospora sp. CA-294931]|uniref:helix-turn-helix domain-containing protein n=1 Tax=Spirillospora sp. CA-294931 TaxID=3240042 RepID=UPI003D8C7517
MGNIAPTIRLRRLGLALKREREAAGLTLDEAAALLVRHATSISRIEKGLHHPKVRDVEYMLTKYGATDPALHDRLYDWSRNGRKKGWWQQFSSDLSPETMDLIGLEGDSGRIDFLELILIPGLLQTMEYARTLLKKGPYATDPAQVERLVSIRMQRQGIVTRKDPPRLRAVLDEAALHRRVGGPAVMQAQLLHLVELSHLPHVSLRVLPYGAGAYPGMTGAFKILELGGPGSLRVVSVDSLTQMSYREKDDEIQTYTDAFQVLCSMALSETDSRALIERLLSSP